jgi:hypothetical protein
MHAWMMMVMRMHRMSHEHGWTLTETVLQIGCFRIVFVIARMKLAWWHSILWIRWIERVLLSLLLELLVLRMMLLLLLVENRGIGTMIVWARVPEGTETFIFKKITTWSPFV